MSVLYMVMSVFDIVMSVSDSIMSVFHSVMSVSKIYTINNQKYIRLIFEIITLEEA